MNENNPFSSKSYSGNNEDEFEFRQLASQIAQNNQELSRNVFSINTIVTKIGTEKDDNQLLTDLQKQQQFANTLAHKIGDQLKALSVMETRNPQDQRRRHLQLEKLRNNFSDILSSFQKAQRNAASKERATVNAAKARADEPPLIHGFGDTEYLSQDQLQAEIPLEELQNRESVIKKLEDDIQGVNDIFKNLAVMVHEQGEVIDSIESHVETTHTFVEGANVELAKATKYQAAARKKLCIFLAVIAAIAIIIALIIYFSVRKTAPISSSSSSTTTTLTAKPISLTPSILPP